jgi:hypothetical protein
MHVYPHLVTIMCARIHAYIDLIMPARLCTHALQMTLFAEPVQAGIFSFITLESAPSQMTSEPVHKGKKVRYLTIFLRKPIFPGISIQDAFKIPQEMRDFLRANGATVLSRQESIQKKYCLARDDFQVQDRVSVVAQVLELWFDRYKIVKKTPFAPNRQPHIVVAASPGKFFLFTLGVLLQSFCLIP